MRRDGAKAGDEIWVSGQPGRAALGLAHLQRRIALVETQLGDCLAALHRPLPRVGLGLALRGLATAAIDVSDGLLADLGHILEQSSLAARLQIPGLPAAGPQRDCLLAGGDDYELVFTVPAARHAEVTALTARLELALTCIGKVETGTAGRIDLHDDDGRPLAIGRRGYDHFA